jgi:pyruvate-formate lyase-activating enzyme
VVLEVEEMVGLENKPFLVIEEQTFFSEDCGSSSFSGGESTIWYDNVECTLRVSAKLQILLTNYLLFSWYLFKVSKELFIYKYMKLKSLLLPLA